MLNVIRTAPSRIKYCGRTVDNLVASNAGAEHKIIICASNKSPNQNGFDALEAGIEASGGKPFVFLEDDLNFIKGFNRSAEMFTENCRGVTSFILPLGAAYKGVRECRGVAWAYPIASFYGTQAFVIEPERAKSLLKFVRALKELPASGFDLLIKEWATHHGQSHFRTPYRAFIQHCGVESSLHNGRFHHFTTWPGTEWTWETGAFSLEEQKKRPCDKKLASEIAAFFGKDRPCYDLGCSAGHYVREMKALGLDCKGFDATPGIACDIIEEVDLSRDQTFQEAPGNVMSLEVAEHIEQANELNFIGNLKALCADKLVLSWAKVGQGGRRHVNERYAPDVVHLVESQGFKYDHDRATVLRGVAQASWFKESIYVFQRRDK